jgi:UMF1 family MFS transporter
VVGGRLSKRNAAALMTPPILAWALYDFASTIFSYAVITTPYFNEWIVIQRDVPDYTVGMMNFGASCALVAALPLFGAAADRWGRRKPFLIAFTIRVEHERLEAGYSLARL